MNRLVAVALLLAGIPAAAAPAGRYIVALRPAAGMPAVRVFGDDAEARRHGARELANLDSFAADLTADEVAALRKSRNVRFVEPVIERHLLEVHTTDAPLAHAQTIPYGVTLVQAPEVWAYSRGAGVNVAVIDTGVIDHPDLAPAAGGYNVLTETADYADDNGHGTHVIGTIAALDNGLGVVGVAPEARIWAVKALDAHGIGDTESVAAAVDWILAKKREIGGRWIVSMSAGSEGSSSAEDDAFRRLRDADVLAVAAAGNSGRLVLDYPAAYPWVLSVGAVDDKKVPAWFSSGGGTLGVMAPGIDILSTAPPGSIPSSTATRGDARTSGIPFQQSARGDAAGGVANCGYGGPGECGDAKGKIALIARGNGLYYAEKVRNAVADGAIAAVIVNYDDSPLFVGSLIRSTCDASFNCVNNHDDETYKWPPVTLLRKSDGDLLGKQSGLGSLSVWDDDYGLKSGTSMAAPHVAGIAALLWSLAPNAHAIDVRRAIQVTAHDLGSPGIDLETGHGMVDALAAAKFIAPALFGLPSPPPPPRRPAVSH